VKRCAYTAFCCFLFFQESKLKELVSRYSEFINFPIYLLTEKEVEVPIDDDATEDKASDETDVTDKPTSEDEAGDDDGKLVLAPTLQCSLQSNRLVRLLSKLLFS
jgi:heat shock protein 90kDa beta